MSSLPNKFYDDSQRFALQAKDLGLIEPAVSLYFNGVLVGGTNYDAVEVFDLAPNNGYPSTFVDLVANTFLRDTYQKADGSSGNYGTSFAGTFSYRPAGGGQALVYIPSVDHADLTVTDSVRYADTVSAYFGPQAQISSTRTFPDPTLAYTTVGVANSLSVQQDIVLATGAVAEQGDVFRAGTLSSMFASATNFDASLILWEDPAGNVHSLALGDGTPRDTHLFAQPQALGSWIELVKEAGSQWYPDSPTIRLTINNPYGLHLGLQGFLAASTNPNDDSLSVWPEILDHPTTLAAGGNWQVDFELIAMAPLVDDATYVTPFSALLTGTPFMNVTLSGTANSNAVGTETGNVLIGNTGNNVLIGGSGDDTLNGGGGNDTLDGGSGEDTAIWQYGVSGSAGVTASLTTGLASGFGNDSLIGIEHLIGSPNADSLTGDGNANALEGEAGNDNLNAAGGDDTLLGGAGVDVLDGGSGADSLSGGDGNDYYFVDNAGDQVVESNAGVAGGNDVVYSALAACTLGANVEIGRIVTGGAASLTGNSLANILYAGSGSGNLNGAAGNDNLIGGSAVDVLDGGSGADTLSGGNGNDYYFVDNVGDVVVESNAGVAGGNDVVYSALAACTLGANVEIGRIVTGGAASLTGNSLANVLYAGAGSATLNGAAGNDTLLGSSGVDVLDGGSGADTLSGGDGNDYYFVDNAGDQVVESNAGVAGGNDVVYSALAACTLGANVEIGRIVASGAASLTGNSLANILYAGAGSATLNGAAGNDNLLGGAGVDVLDGGSGADSMSGGNGNDYYFVDNVGDQVVESNASVAGGNDVVYSALAAYTLGANVEIGRIVTGGAASLTGNALANLLFAGSGDNVLDGAAGNDTLAGGLGNDLLIGGSGADTFRFDTAPNGTSNLETIGDFSVVDDTIVLENAVFTSLLASGPLAAGAFRAGAGASSAADADDYLIYDTTTGALYYDAAGNTGDAPVQIALLGSGLALTALDFVVI